MSTEPALSQPAGLFRRLAAAVYDGLLLMGLLFLATLIVLPVLPAHRIAAGVHWFQMYLFCVIFLFYGWFWTHGGQTLGMRAWRLRVENLQGGKLRWIQACIRFLAAIIAWASVIGLLSCVFDSQHRALHDWLSRTRVMILPKA